jgi:hypothetical protein
MFTRRRPTPAGKDSRSRRLPLRWAFIVAISIVAGIGIGIKAGLGAGIMAGVSVSVGLHTLID